MTILVFSSFHTAWWGRSLEVNRDIAIIQISWWSPWIHLRQLFRSHCTAGGTRRSIYIRTSLKPWSAWAIWFQWDIQNTKHFSDSSGHAHSTSPPSHQHKEHAETSPAWSVWQHPTQSEIPRLETTGRVKWWGLHTNFACTCIMWANTQGMTTAGQQKKSCLVESLCENEVSWKLRIQVVECFRIPTLEDDVSGGWLLYPVLQGNSFFKEKIKWSVYNKSALIGTWKKKKNPKESSKEQQLLVIGNWFYSDCGWFHRLWALGNSVKYLPLKHSAIQTEPLIVIQNAKSSFAISALKVVLKAPEGRKNGREVERKWRESVVREEVLNSQKTWGKETIKNEHAWNQNLSEWSAQVLGQMTPWLSHSSVSKPFCLSSLLTSFPYWSFSWLFSRSVAIWKENMSYYLVDLSYYLVGKDNHREL